jgi:hypothetical protein
MPWSRSGEQFREGSTPILHLQLYKQDNGRVTKKLSLAELSTLTLTYFNQSTGSTINSRTNQNVKNANDVVVTADCEIIWKMTSSDTACAVTSLEDEKLEHHIALFEWVLTNGMKGSTRVSVYIIRDSKV